MENFDLKERIWGGVFGILAICAAIMEMFANGVTLATFAGALKDVSGTLVVVVLLIAVVRHYMPKKINNFSEAFDLEMSSIINRYSPLVKKDDSYPGRYNLASKLSAIYDNETGAFHTFFDFNGESEISFYVRKQVFMGPSKDDFDDMKKKIISDIIRNIEGKYDIVSKCANFNDGFKISFSRKLIDTEDAKKVVEVIDKVTLLYIAEYKKS